MSLNGSVTFEKHKLGNGLDVILHVDRTVPIVAVNLWYHVGSARETPGKSGFAHLFEHMMFQGSKHVENGLHFKLIEDAGGTLNGSTSTDRTNYWATVPKNYLESILWLESDRMGWLIPAMTQQKLDTQIDVVKNERRQNYDNRPYGLAFEILSEHLYPASHPYSWSTIGSMEDIGNATLDDVQAFFKRYYGPNNASLCIGGDIDVDETKALVEKYFGGIPAGPPVGKPEPHIPDLHESNLLVHEDDVQLPRVYTAWHTSHLFGENDAETDMTVDVLAQGKNSRLYRSLIYEKQIAQDVSFFHLSREIGSLAVVVATARPDVTLDRLQTEIDAEIVKYVEEGPTAREYGRVRNAQKSSFTYSLQQVGGFYGVTDRLNEYNTYLDDPGRINADLDRYMTAQKEDIRAAAETYLQPSKRVVLSVVPKGRRNLAVGETA
jgi:zinc protease